MTLFDDPQPAAPSAPLVRVRLVVAYHGARFHGVAPQASGVRTVCGELAVAIERVLGSPPGGLTVAGRTDAGVHAWGQVMSFDTPAGNADAIGELAWRLSRILGPEIVVRSADVVDDEFCARRSALSRSYRYTILNRPVPDPFMADRAWWFAEPLDIRGMQAACDPLIGEHDFSSFCRQEKDSGRSLVRNVRSAEVVSLGDGVLRFDVTARSFCQQMVRALAGTLVDVGRGRLHAGDIAGILRARDRSAAGPVAPAHGLCLWEVEYP
jgi:tRNA pseudouridine38-40 synthase